MERIASFCVDHTTLEPGVYLSRRDGEVMTWDIRMKKPNQGSYLSPACAHTIEHLFATRARNSRYADHVIYVGPMGCLTGFYLLTEGMTDAEVLDLVRECFAWMAEYDGPIPGASAPECGNYLMMDPIAARAECRAMLPVLAAADADNLRYRT
ncbi:MAG: S-ribosylhomocysteine lyase [Oscillospiraceae bacterium]|nr:S-ribosylhomocysteine lyase [Oscillospiraceae bacterium]